MSRGLIHAISASLLATAAATAPTATAAQSPPSPPAPPAAGSPVANGRNPAVSYLMGAYNLSEAEAANRIEIQGEVLELSRRINASKDPAFAGILIQHAPVYKIILSFADNKDRKALLEGLSPKLRRYVQLRVAKKSRSGRRGDIETLRTALGGGQATALRAGEAKFIIGFDAEAETYRVEVPSQEEADRLSKLVPESLRGSVRFVVSRLPRPEQTAPSGVQPGDWATAGYTLYSQQDANAVKCTMGYSVRYGINKTPGILTAAHCNLPYYLYYNNHWITFHSPLYKSWTKSHDFQILNVSNMNTADWVFYRDINGIPEFAAEGWFHTVGLVPWSDQWNGDVVCKSGAVTGITCGEIIDDSYDYGQGGELWIKVGHTKQYDISNPGDSGGPWFFYPGTSSNVYAVGIHTAGEKTGAESIAVYMPIDRIDDNVPVELILMQ